MGQNKLSGYQKLKKENQELRQKLVTLVHCPNSKEATEIKSEIQFSINIENAVWQGDITSKENEGLLKRIADAE